MEQQPKPNFTISPEKAAKYPELVERYEAEGMNAPAPKQTDLQFNPMSREENESIKVLLDEPVVFHCPTIFRRLFGKKTDTWSIRYQPYDTLVRLGREYAKLEIDEDQIGLFGIEEAKKLSVQQSLIFARIAAIAVVGTMPFESILRPLATHYFYKRMHPRLAVQLCLALNKQGEYGDFMLSIRLTRGRRLTEPALIDHAKKA